MFPGHGRPREVELARLRKKVEARRETNEILKKWRPSLRKKNPSDGLPIYANKSQAVHHQGDEWSIWGKPQRLLPMGERWVYERHKIADVQLISLIWQIVTRHHRRYESPPPLDVGLNSRSPFIFSAHLPNAQINDVLSPSFAQWFYVVLCHFRFVAFVVCVRTFTSSVQLLQTFLNQMWSFCFLFLVCYSYGNEWHPWCATNAIANNSVRKTILAGNACPLPCLTDWR